MTKLLVSVRNASEALTALDAGVDLIDIKEPDRGAMGAADPATIAAVVSTVADRVPTSAALGELHSAGDLPASLPVQLHFAKLGLAGCLHDKEWPTQWRAVIASLPAGIAPVAVAYADFRGAHAPEPWSLLPLAHELGYHGLLLDTFDKRGGGLGACFNSADLQRWIEAVRSAGMMSVVAGGLGLDDIADIAKLRPDYIGVRGAACTEGRAGTVDAGRIRALLQALGRKSYSGSSSTFSLRRESARNVVLPG
jgi:(5-formylfuran-3-yl)methyl phosphate synthase